MSISSPYAVFRADEVSWPPYPALTTPPSAICVPSLASPCRLRPLQLQTMARIQDGSVPIQGELFQLA